MMRYLVTYHDKAGVPRVERLPAASAVELRNHLLEAGCSSIVIYDTDGTARAWNLDANRGSATPAEELDSARALSSRPRAFWRRRETLLGLATLALFVGGGVSFARNGSTWEGFFMTFLGIACGRMAVASHTLVLYGDLYKAMAHQRWDEVERHARRMQCVGRVLMKTLVVIEARLLLARCRAARGDLAGAVQEYDSVRVRAGWPETTYWARLEAVYDAARDVDGALMCLRRAFEIPQDGGSAHVDYALALADHTDEAELAERILGSRSVESLPPVALIFVSWTRGLIALRRGRCGEAAGWFTDALESLAEVYSDAPWYPVRRELLTGLGRALAQLGDPLALPTLLEVESYVRAAAGPMRVREFDEALALASAHSGPSQS